MAKAMTEITTGEITDKMIVLAALRLNAKTLWHEVESGSRYFGVYLYVDIFERIIKIENAIREGETENCLMLPLD